MVLEIQSMQTIQLLINEEEFLCRRYLDHTLAQLVEPETRDFNFDRLSLRETPFEKILSLLQTPPMMAQQRIVVVEDCEEISKKEEEAFEKYLESLNPQTVCLLITKKIDKRTTFYKKLKTVALIQEFKKPYPNQLPQFVQEQAKRLSISLAPGVAQILIEIAGQDLSGLVMELEKLRIYIAPKTQITKEDVLALSSQGLVDNIWDLTSALGKKDFAASLNLFRRILEQGNPVIALAAMVITHFRKLLIAVEYKDQPANEPLEKILGVHPYFVKDYEKQARGFSAAQLKKLYQKLMRLSEDLRSAPVAKELLFTNFLTEVCV